MKSKKSKGWLGLLIVLIALVGFTYLAITSAKQIKLGLDLAGGVSITYQAKDEHPKLEDMKDTVYKLHQRVTQYSTEAEVYLEGDRRINIDIPGVSKQMPFWKNLESQVHWYFKDQMERRF